MKEQEDTTKSGIILTSNSQENYKIAEVIEVGLGEIRNGKREDMYVKKGDNVIVTKFSGSEIKYEGVEYLILKQEDILAIID